MTDSKNKFVGEVETSEGKLGVKAYIGVIRDEREIKVFQLEDGSLGFVTESYLRINNREKVTHAMRFTEKTFVMLLETLHLSAIYFGIDVNTQIRALADGKNNIEFEYGGNGEFKFDEDKLNEKQ